MGRDRLLIGFTSSLNDVSHMGLTKKSWLIIIFPINTAILNRQTAIFGRTNILPVISHGSWHFCAKLQLFMTMPSLFQGRCSIFSPCSWIICIYTHNMYYIYNIIYIWILFCPPPMSPYLEWFFHFFSWPSQRPSDCDHGSTLGASQ